eukprot:1344595-Amphidinium_carterae.3
MAKIQRVHAMHMRKVCRLVPASQRDRGEEDKALTRSMATQNRGESFLARVASWDHSAVRAAMIVQGITLARCPRIAGWNAR